MLQRELAYLLLFASIADCTPQFHENKLLTKLFGPHRLEISDKCYDKGDDDWRLDLTRFDPSVFMHFLIIELIGFYWLI